MRGDPHVILAKSRLSFRQPPDVAGHEASVFPLRGIVLAPAENVQVNRLVSESLATSTLPRVLCDVGSVSPVDKRDPLGLSCGEFLVFPHSAAPEQVPLGLKDHCRGLNCPVALELIDDERGIRCTRTGSACRLAWVASQETVTASPVVTSKAHGVWSTSRAD